jgi:hypothetical protein
MGTFLDRGGRASRRSARNTAASVAATTWLAAESSPGNGNAGSRRRGWLRRPHARCRYAAACRCAGSRPPVQPAPRRGDAEAEGRELDVATASRLTPASHASTGHCQPRRACGFRRVRGCEHFRWRPLQADGRAAAGLGDFSRVIAEVLGCYMMLGARIGDASSVPDNHSPRVQFDESVMADGISCARATGNACVGARQEQRSGTVGSGSATCAAICNLRLVR